MNNQTHSESPTPSLPYMPALDGLRAIAVALVIWHHTPFVFDRTLYSSPWWRMSVMGWVGVDLFFAVSGFLITTILIQTKGRNGYLRRFWIRRVLRIMPLAYLYMLVMILLSLYPVAISNGSLGFKNVADWPWYLSYLANFRIAAEGWSGRGTGLLWSLAVEEQFYFVWPFVILLLNRKWTLIACVSIILISPMARYLTFLYTERPGIAVYVLPWCRFDGLAAGSLLAILMREARYRESAIKWCKLFSLPAFLILLGAMTIPIGYMDSKKIYPRDQLAFAVFGYSYIALASAVLVGAAIAPGTFLNKLLGGVGLRFLGRRAYGIYIWHLLAGILLHHFVSQILRLQTWQYIISWCVLIVIIASASWALYEKPMLKLKKRFEFGTPQSK